MTSIAVTTAPTKTKYVVGESFESAGMVITATYSDSTSAVVTGYTVSPSGALAATDTSVTITYGGKTTTQTISVGEISSIAITTAPTKVSYTAGENFDPTGMVVTATYSNSETRVIENTDLTYSPALDAELAVSDTEETITYLTKTATQAITVTE